jgi:hypothetical protein
MSCHPSSDRCLRGSLSLGLAVGLLTLAAAAMLPTPAHGRQFSEDQGPREGYLYNLTRQPFSFQLHRTEGPAWTSVYTIPQEQRISVRAPRAGQRSEIQGITGDNRGFVLIRYWDPVLNGYTMFKLPAQNPADQRFEPTWFAVKDSTGITRLVQEPSIEQARAVQQQLQQQAPLNADELDRTKRTMRANWVLSIPQD